MVNLLVRGLNGLSQFSYIAGRSRMVKAGVLLIIALVITAVVVNHAARSEDITVYPLPVASLRATVTNHYVLISGNLLMNSAYQVHTRTAGIIDSTLRFVPFLPTGSPEPIMLLDQNLAPKDAVGYSMTFVGKYLRGGADLPDYYLQVSDPPSMLPYDALAWLSVILLSAVLGGGVVTWLIRRIDYAIPLPCAARGFSTAKDGVNTSAPSYLLWFGSLGAAYADVILREVPVSFKAIPAQARLVPVQNRDAWMVTIHLVRAVSLTTIATSYGALPAMRLEFEDERGITRDGLIAGSDRKVVDSILNILRFVGHQE